MNTLDHFLNLLNLKIRLDAFCTMREPYASPHEALPQGQAYFHLLLSGRCTVVCDDGSQCEMQPGDFLLLAEGSGHTLRGGDQSQAFENVHEENYGRIWRTSNHGANDTPDMEMLCGFYRTDNPASSLLMRQFPRMMCVSLRDHGELDALCAIIRREGQAQHMGSTTVIHHLCEILLLFALRKSEHVQMNSGLLALFADPALHNVLRHILADIAQTHSTEALAEIACQSRATFARHFQKAAGMGVQRFIRTLRMMEAARLLTHSHLPISHIAERCGYQSDSAFHDNFRAQFATTPAKYRRDSRTMDEAGNDLQ